MAQFSVHTNPNPKSRAAVPYVVVLQSDLIVTSRTTIIAAVARKPEPAADAKLQLAVSINGEPLVVLFQSLTAIDTSRLGPEVVRLPELRDRMMTAIDLVFLGF